MVPEEILAGDELVQFEDSGVHGGKSDTGALILVPVEGDDPIVVGTP